jgi:hypothetical protein
MTWRRFHLLLCLIAVVVGVLRLVSGNIIGAVLAFVLAAVFGSIGADYPLLPRLHDLARMAYKRWRGKD